MMKKKLTALSLSLVMCMTLCVPAVASNMGNFILSGITAQRMVLPVI